MIKLIILLCLGGLALAFVTGPRNERIVKGTAVAEGDIEFVAMVASNSSQNGERFCAGSLIDPQWILTAASCVDKQTEVVVMLGSVNPLNMSIIDNSTTIVVHPNYKPGHFANNLAMIMLTRNVENIKPVPIMKLQPRCELQQANYVVAGYGAGFDRYQNLHKVDVTILTEEMCKNMSRSVTEDTTLCSTSIDSDGAGADRADFGGPLLAKHKHTTFLLGVVSWGLGNATHSMTNGFTRVAFHSKWIQMVIDQPLKKATI